MLWRICLLTLSLLVCACRGRGTFVPTAVKGTASEIVITSPAFAEGEMIPAEYTCQGKNSSPALEWSALPTGTQSLALICDDPDAPGATFVHWVLYALPATTRGLPAGIASQATLDNGAVQGKNGAQQTGYTGPCPPSGTHRYYFRLYALDNKPALQARATKAELLKAIEGHILGEGQLMGKYQKR
jgi:Raf kinase inhibitor-like YbhB/YbcL family protein